MDFMLLLFLYLPSIIMVSSILIFPIMFIKILSSYRKKNDFNTKKIIIKIIILISLAFFSFVFYFLAFLTNTIVFYLSVILLIIYLITSIIFIIRR